MPRSRPHVDTGERKLRRSRLVQPTKQFDHKLPSLITSDMFIVNNVDEFLHQGALRRGGVGRYRLATIAAGASRAAARIVTAMVVGSSVWGFFFISFRELVAFGKASRKKQATTQLKERPMRPGSPN